jgi:WNK lysine deficient protein kinase
LGFWQEYHDFGDDNLDSKIYSVGEFVHEAQALFALKHPNIIEFKGISVTSNARFGRFPKYIVLELASFGDLMRYLTLQLEKVTAHFLLSICRDTLKALSYLHSLSPPILHRDIKPVNLLVCASTSVGPIIVKLGDFELSREWCESTMTASVGALRYMAPEVADGSRYGTSVDVYSFAMSILDIVCQFFQLEDELGKPRSLRSMDHWQSSIVALGTALLDLDAPELARLLKTCVSNDPIKRPTAAEALASVDDIISKYEMPEMVRTSLCTFLFSLLSSIHSIR